MGCRKRDAWSGDCQSAEENLTGISRSNIKTGFLNELKTSA